MQNRSVLSVVLLMLFTCGIYAIYLQASLHQETWRELGQEKNFGTNVLLIIITCGIWGIVLNYETAKNYVSIAQLRGVVTSDNSVLIIIFCVLGFGIVSNALLQDQQNNLINQTKTF